MLVSASTPQLLDDNAYVGDQGQFFSYFEVRGLGRQ